MITKLPDSMIYELIDDLVELKDSRVGAVTMLLNSRAVFTGLFGCSVDDALDIYDKLENFENRV